MTRFEILQTSGIELSERGLINQGIFMKYIRYCVYLDFIAQGLDKVTATEQTAIRTKCSELTVWRSVKFFTDEQWSGWKFVQSEKKHKRLKSRRKSALSQRAA